MTWEQKAQALQSLLIFGGNFGLRMRSPGDWYVSLPGVEVKEGCMLKSPNQIDCPTPEIAVHTAWEQHANIRLPLKIRTVDGYRHVKWNGFMWKDVEAHK